MVGPSRSPSRFFSQKQVADQLGVDPKTVQRWIKAGQLIVHAFGRSIRISEEDLRNFIASRRKI